MLTTTRASRPVALGLTASLTLPMLIAGCGSPAPQAPQPVPGPQAGANTGLTTKQKVVLLAGAAALYYMYNRYKKQNAAELANQNVQYYLSKNGRVYYRDPKNPQNVIWVTPPQEQAGTIRVPQNEATQYQGFSGYDGQTSGRTLRDVFPVR